MSTPPRSEFRVLIIEDSPTDQDLLEAAFREGAGWRYVVTCVATGHEGLSASRQDEFDCILLDYRLPDVDGLTLLPKLARAGAPVVMITGQGDERIATKAMKMGAADYVTKSDLTNGVLRRAVHAAVDGFRAKRRADEQAEDKHRALALQMSAVKGLARGDERVAQMFGQTSVPVAELRGPGLIFGWMNPAMRAVIGREALLNPHLNLEGAFGPELMSTARAFLAGLLQSDEASLRCGFELKQGDFRRRFVTFFDHHADRIDEIDGLILTLIEEPETSLPVVRGKTTSPREA